MISLMTGVNYQNFELGLSVLKASDIPLPKAVLNLGARDVIESSINMFMVFETLRQAQILGLNFKNST